MGTNFYYQKDKDAEEIHIGKRSAGWAFGLHIHPDKLINNIGDWVELFYCDCLITDDCGSRYTKQEMLDIIFATYNGRHHSVDGSFCVETHPSYDCLLGDFS